MKHILGVVAFALLAVGCATSSSVKDQIDPLADRLTKVERQQADMQAKLTDVNSKMDAQAADMHALRKDLAESNAAAQKAQQAAMDAQEATARAETAATKATKAFELHQKKGGK